MKNIQKYRFSRHNFFIVFLFWMYSGSIIGQENIRVKYNNPDLPVDMGGGLWGTPIPVDYDGDGVMDIIISCPDTPFRGLYFFKNIGTADNPFFDAPQQISTEAYGNTQASYVNGKLYVMNPAKLYSDFKNNLMNNPQKIKYDIYPGHDMQKARSNMWSMVDFDGDGDLDIVTGIDTWSEYGWDNAYSKEGVWLNGPLRGYMYLLENKDGEYLNRGRIMAGDIPLETYGAPGANVADFDGDGDLDIICGEFLDKLTWFRNSGTRKNPKYEKGQILLDNKGDTMRLHTQMIVPVAVDFNNDGHIDLIVGDEDGRIAYIKNTGKVKNKMPIFCPPVYFKQKAYYLKFGALVSPFSADWDGDGLEDLICGNSSGNIAFIKNLGGKDTPKWDTPVLLKSKGKEIRLMAGNNGSIQGPAEAKWGYTTLSVADWDNDGKPDIIVNSIFGEIIWYKNNGDLLNLEGPYPVLVDWDTTSIPKPVWNWWNPNPNTLVTQWRTTPVAIDWNKDGLVDLIVLDQEGYLSYYERFDKNGVLYLKPGKRIFYMEDVSEYDPNNKMVGKNTFHLRLNALDAGRSGRRKLCLTDWNNDGRLDIIVNSKNVCLFENIRQVGDTAYFVNKGDLSDYKLAGHDTSPTPVDWDKDGIFDILVGGEDGHFYIIKNTLKK